MTDAVDAVASESEEHWFGRIPAGWSVKRNKEIFQEVSKLSTTGKETLLTVSHITGVTPRSEKNVNMFMAEDMAGYKLCEPGDLLINTMWAWMGALGASKHHGICSPAYGVYRPRRGVDYHPGYFDYLLRTPSAVLEMTRFSKGIVSSRLRLYPRDFYRIEVCLPPYKEQKAIADYLDEKTDLIKKKIFLIERKIYRYQSLKKSVLNQICFGEFFMTDRYDKNNLPGDWEVRRVKDLAFLQSGDSIKSEQLMGTGYPAFGGNGVRGFINDYNNEGDFVLIGRQGALCGNINFASGRFWASEHAVVVHHRKNVDFYWLGNVLKLMNLNQYSLSAAQPGLSVDKIKNLLLPVPPAEKQREIASFLREEDKKFKRFFAKLNSQLERLNELHKTLINDAVTGKIKLT